MNERNNKYLSIPRSRRILNEEDFFKYINIFINDLKNNTINNDEIENFEREILRKFKHLNFLLEYRTDKLREEKLILGKQRETLLNEIEILKNKNNVLNKKLLIKVPKILEDSKSDEYSNNLISLINEINICYINGAFTAVGLIARKIILNLSHTLSKLDSDSESMIPYTFVGKDEKKRTINKSNEHTFETLVSWLFENNYLTKNNFNVLNLLRQETNDLNHDIKISENIEDSSKYFLTIKGLIESNFENNGFESESNFENNGFESELIKEDVN